MDYILGLEKEDNSSNPARNTYYKTFSSPMQRILTSYCQSGGHLLVSGAYVGTIWTARRAIKIYSEYLEVPAWQLSENRRGQNRCPGTGAYLHPSRLPNEQSYPVTSPDCIPAHVSRFSSHDLCHRQHTRRRSLSSSDYRTFVMGFPFESIREETSRNVIMASILRFLTTDYTD